ncbi:MAG: hypothetical protein QOF57_1480 [Frankiaceae bacterium]|nr:hypothetical protein [Frankiaceae bacterium]
MIHIPDLRRLTQPRIATALCLAVLLAVGGATGLLWQRLATTTGAQLALQRDLVALDGVVARLAQGDASAGSAYLQQRAALESHVVAAASAAESERDTLLAAAAGVAAVLLIALAAVVVADVRRRRRPAQPTVEPDAAPGSYQSAALLRDLDLAARRAVELGSPLACVVVEVDHFAAYAQTQGAAAGELLLAEIADIVRDAVRASDGAYRCDETTFVLTLPDTDCLAAVRLAERLRESIVRALLGEGVTVSAGVAGIPSGAGDATDLLAAAGAALADARRHGRNQVRRAAVPPDELAAARENVGRH